MSVLVSIIINSGNPAISCLFPFLIKSGNPAISCLLPACVSILIITVCTLAIKFSLFEKKLVCFVWFPFVPYSDINPACVFILLIFLTD